MLLCIDIGNTNTVLATFEGEKIVHSWRVKTDARLDRRRAGPDVPRPARRRQRRGHRHRGLLNRTGRAAVAALHAGPLLPVGAHGDRRARRTTGVQLAIDNPKEVGTDRVVNTLAAYTLYGGPSIVVDFGTSTNFDVVSARGEFLGGVLAPGIEISVDALAARAAQLRKVELVRPPRGDRQEHRRVPAVRRGLRLRRSGRRHRRGRSSRRSGRSAPWSPPAGWPGWCSTSARTVTHHEPRLTLIGLRMVYERNLPRRLEPAARRLIQRSSARSARRDSNTSRTASRTRLAAAAISRTAASISAWRRGVAVR